MKSHKNFSLDNELRKCKSMDDLIGKNGLIQKMIGGMVEQLLEQEMEDHLGYERYSTEGHHSGNSRNGRTKKTLKTSHGPVEVEVPRDRCGSFDPQLVKKRQTSISGFDDKIISMYAKGMSTRDIQDHVQEIYGADISPTMVSNITNKIYEVATEWQSRALDSVYPIIYFDAIHYKVREGGKVVNKASYTCLGVNCEGKKEILGIWVGESEGAKFWLRVCTELKNRGVKDIFIACIDGLKGLPDAIQSVYPEIDVQLCVIHMIRNSIKYIPHKYSKEFISDLKQVYEASTKELAEINLLKLQEKWEEKYPLAVTPWVNHWENVSSYFKYPSEIRRLIYTTNAVESLHRQFRKVTKTKTVFPSDESLVKMLFLSIRDITKKWTMPVRGWKEAISYFSIAYAERLEGVL